jgi:stage II sporulation SpoE-like protein
MTGSEPVRKTEGVTPSRFLRRAVISTLIGVAVTFLTTFDVSPGFRLRLLTYGGMGGFLINAWCHVLGKAFSGWLARRVRGGKVFLALLYFVGGLLGLTTATAVAAATSLVPVSSIRSFIPVMTLLSSAVAVVVGLVFYTFGMMENRLRESVERLKEHEFAEKELELAREIQKRLLPPSEIESNGYRVSSRNVAARFVAGDFYDVFPLAGGALGVAVADVSGKGMGASLIMASVKAVLPLVAGERSVEATLAALNKKLVAELGPREFVALAYVRFEPDGRFTLANAGLPDPYVVGSGAGPRALGVGGGRFPLGLRGDVEYRSLEGRLQRGEKLLLFTDGLPEAPKLDGDPIGYAALERLLDGDSRSPGAFLDGLLERLRAATAPTLSDDWTAVAVEWTR